MTLLSIGRDACEANHLAQFWKKADDGQGTGDMHVPDEWLNADIKQGISQNDVESRRKRFGWNEITTEKENLFIKFLGFFTGPILYGQSQPSTPPADETHPSATGGIMLSQCIVASFVLLFGTRCEAQLELPVARSPLGVHAASYCTNQPAAAHANAFRSHGTRRPPLRWSS